MTKPDRPAYFRSLADEITSQSQRVRNLIGNKHWLSDGHHKESLIRSVIARHAPSTVLVSRGFIASPTAPDLCSREQDILVVDTRFQGPLFDQADLVIALASTVIAAISVKSTLGKRELSDSIECLNSARAVCAESSADPPAMWCGAFFFRANDQVNAKPERVYEYYQEGLQSSPAPSHVPGCSAPHPPGPHFVCCSEPDLAFSARSGSTPSCFELLGFRCSGLATALFVGTLLDHISERLAGTGSDFAQAIGLPGIDPLDPPSVELSPEDEGTA